MASLPNYLHTNRKRQALSQEEVAFLLGVNGLDRGIKVSREETGAREPSLLTALAYEAIYGTPVRELFAGLYEEEARKIAKRARILGYRKGGRPNLNRQQTITNLISIDA